MKQTHLNTDDMTDFVEALNSTRQWQIAREVELNNAISIPGINNDTARFFRITELTAEKEATLRQDIENVIACLDNPDFRWVYYLSGSSSGVELYFGVVRCGDSGNVYEYAELLKSQLQGNLAGMKMQSVPREKIDSNILSPLQASRHFGLLQGVPSQTLDRQSGENTATQGIDRLTRALAGEDWQLLIINEPVSDSDISQQIDSMMQLSSELNPYVKYSLQKGESSSHTTGSSKGSSTTHGVTETTGESQSTSETRGDSRTETDAKGRNTGGSKGSTRSKGTSASETQTDGTSRSSSSSSTGKTAGKNTSTSSNRGENWGESTTQSVALGSSESTATTKGSNTGKSIARSEASNTSDSSSDTTGSSHSNTVEYLNKKVERVQQHINDVLIERFSLGHSKGMFRTAVYIAARSKTIYDRLSSGMTSVFQGNQSHFTPLKVAAINMSDGVQPEALFRIQQQPAQPQSSRFALIHSIPHSQQALHAATWLNASELSLLVGLPSREITGVALRKNVDFAVNPINPQEGGFELGCIIQNGRKLDKTTVRLDRKLLNQHLFVCGVTGSGKTTTCQQILTAAKLPFLVIEPAKTEYRSLSALLPDMQFYTLGNESISPFRFNPFELLPNEKLSGHIDMLKATFAAVFPMEAAMPYLIEEAIVESYKKKGWDIHENENYLYDDPWACKGKCWPIMSEMLETLKAVIESKGFGRDLQEKYEGSLIARLDNLTVGVKGRMLNTRNSVDIADMLDSQVVIELEDLRDEQDKALMMGLLLNRIAEAVKQRHSIEPGFQHITLLEEAHRLLSKPTLGDEGAKKLGVEQFANLLAEVRKYGESLIIADQIPNKLTPEVIKNTNTKIIHRLFAADDRHAIGDTVGLSDEQKDFLPLLQAGEVVAYSAGWHAAVRMQVHQINDTGAPVISEQKLIDMGTQHLFAQRHRLYPHVSDCCDWQDAQAFRSFVRQGIRYINLWIQWRAKDISSDVTDQIARRYAQNMRQALSQLELATALAALYRDTVCIREIVEEQGMQRLFAALLADATGFAAAPDKRGLKADADTLFHDLGTV